MLAMNKNEENRSVYYLWGGVTLSASCGLAVCPGCEERKKDMPEGEKNTWREKEEKIEK